MSPDINSGVVGRNIKRAGFVTAKLQGNIRELRETWIGSACEYEGTRENIAATIQHNKIKTILLAF